MGRKWTNMKLVFEDRDAPIPEPSATPKTQEEAVEEYITNRWDSDNIPNRKNIDVMFGNFSTDKIESVAKDFLTEFNFINKVGVVFVSDSAYSGYGWVFKQSNGEVECVEEYYGYEGANGEDVAGEMYDDYLIRLNPEWCWD